MDMRACVARRNKGEVCIRMKKSKHKLVTLGILFTIATGIIYLINRLIFASATLKDLLKSSANNYYNWRFGKIYYKKKGSGSPILLIHDLTVYSSAYEWKNVIDNLAKSHTVYAVDLLGCGRSEKPRITYTNYLYVQLISDFIKNVIHEKTDILASGYSGSFSILACHNESSLFGKIFLVNPPELTTLNKIPGKKSKLYKFLLELPVFGTLVYNMITCQSNVQLLFTENYLYNPFDVTAEMIDTYYEAAHKGFSNSKFLLSSIIGCYTNNSINHALRETNQSIILITGEEEENGKNVQNAYTSINPSIETCYIEKTKHLPHLEAANRFIEFMNIYL